MYLFPRLDPELYPVKNDEQFVLDLLQDQKILVSHGSAFNWPQPDHFRFVILPSVEDIEEAVRRISAFLAAYRSS
jgi:alanine-synthesizing transaminase